MSNPRIIVNYGPDADEFVRHFRDSLDRQGQYDYVYNASVPAGEIHLESRIVTDDKGNTIPPPAGEGNFFAMMRPGHGAAR
jgi:hypothetical protein